MTTENAQTSSEPTVEVELNLLRHSALPGWGESKMELLEKAKQDLVNASVLLVRIRGDLDHDPACLESMITEKVERAIERIEMCHNDLDCEREQAEEGGAS